VKHETELPFDSVIVHRYVESLLTVPEGGYRAAVASPALANLYSLRQHHRAVKHQTDLPARGGSDVF
jgi:hypothetical protein